jgi:disulfide bond formation protein DsbB
VEKSQMADVFAVLTVVAVLGGLTTVVVTVRAALGSASAATLREQQWLTVLGWGAAVAITCTLGSLYLSEVEPAYPPCRFCWFQRIAMYPLALLLPIAWVRRDRGIKWYAIPVAGIGAAISTYHVLLERIPSLDTGSCDPTNPCTIRWIDHWGGWITIPSMALVGFLTIIAALVWIPSHRIGRTHADPDASIDPAGSAPART